MIKEIRCSSLHRPMNCIGFLSIENLQESEEGLPAKEGTACGELLSEMIRQGTPNPTFGPYATNGIFLNQDMWFYARATYQDICTRSEGNKIETEERIDWMTKAGIKIRGQFDISFINRKTVLNIEDLKFGWKIVDVKENWQLIGYAIGQMQRLYRETGFMATHVNFRIHQPRPYHPDGRIREWFISYEELLPYWQRIEEKMIAYVNGDRTLSTGKSCQYCEALNSCPAMNRSVYKSVETVMSDDWQDKVIGNEELAKEYELLGRVQEILKIKRDSLKQLAIMRLQNNQIIPGYTYEPELGDRKWKDNVTAKSILAFTGKDITKIDILSPNQAEKMGVPRKLVAQLTERAHKGADLVKKDVTDEALKILPKPY